jgi:NAD+ synthase (glutamine-hydrolysing)
MRLALAQLNATVGDLRGNAQKIRAMAAEAATAGADLLLTPELALCGYPPQDLLFKRHFVRAAMEEVEALSADLPLPALIGTVWWGQEGEQLRRPVEPYARVASEAPQGLANAAVLVRNGQVECIARKRLLPTYDVFDEGRYFRPGDPCTFELQETRVGATVCEDLWDEAYSDGPVPELIGHGARVILNISASPFHVGHFAERVAVLQRHARGNSVPIAYCNLVGGQDELVFDGRSLVVDGQGEIVALARAYEEELLIVDLPETATEVGATRNSETHLLEAEPEVLGALVLGLRDYARKCGFSTAVLGLSGGVDSALVACLAADALGPSAVTAIAMPARYTADYSTADAAELAEKLRIGFHVVPIEDTLPLTEQRFATEFGTHRSPITLENMQSRERGQVLMEYSNDRGALLLATGNKTEYALGYSTLYGDMCGGLAVIGDLSKPEVYALARWYNAQHGSPIPVRILDRAPSAELAANQVDPFDYDVIGPLTDLVVERQFSLEELVERGYIRADVERVMRLVRLSEYKRKQAAPILRVSGKAFGIGRRMPIVNHFPE